MRTANSSVKATAASARQAARQQRSEQQEAEHDHEACVEKVGALEGKWHGQEQQRRERDRQATCRRRAATARRQAGEQEGGDGARRRHVERQDVVGERKHQLLGLVGDGGELGFVGERRERRNQIEDEWRSSRRDQCGDAAQHEAAACDAACGP